MNDRQLNNFLNHVHLPVDEEGEIIEGLCWVWYGHTLHEYGRFNASGRTEYSHRVMYEHCYGDIPEGFQVHHKCENKACVNPDHLEASSVASHRSLHRKTYCKRGHKLVGRNILYRYRKGIEIRTCRICFNASSRKGYAKKRLEKLQVEDAKMVELSKRLIEEEIDRLEIFSSLDKRRKS